MDCSVNLRDFGLQSLKVAKSAKKMEGNGLKG